MICCVRACVYAWGGDSYAGNKQDRKKGGGGRILGGERCGSVVGWLVGQLLEAGNCGDLGKGGGIGLVVLILHIGERTYEMGLTSWWPECFNLMDCHDGSRSPFFPTTGKAWD